MEHSSQKFAQLLGGTLSLSMAGGTNVALRPEKWGTHGKDVRRTSDGQTGGRGRMRKRVTHNATNIANKGEIIKLVIELVQQLPLFPSSLSNAGQTFSGMSKAILIIVQTRNGMGSLRLGPTWE